jgi:hypothetical protein
MHLGILQAHSLGHSAISFKFANEASELHSERREEESTNSAREALRKWRVPTVGRRTSTSPSVRVNILELEVPVTQLNRGTVTVEC